MSLEATSVNAPKAPEEILTPLDVLALEELNAMKTMIALVNLPVKAMFVSILAALCPVESMPFAFLNAMQPGADVNQASLKTNQLANVSASVMEWSVASMLNALSALRGLLVSALKA